MAKTRTSGPNTIFLLNDRNFVLLMGPWFVPSVRQQPHSGEKCQDTSRAESSPGHPPSFAERTMVRRVLRIPT
jgi:hypothetical protein